MKKLGLLIKTSNPEAVRLGSEIARWLSDRGGEVYVESGLSGRVSPAKAVSREEMPELIEVLLVLGGDGTMLAAARLLDGRPVPLVGVNLGGLGFLTAITVDEVYRLLERVLADRFEKEERMLLSVSLKRRGEVVSAFRVLNDAVIKGASARLVRMETRINREYVTTYRADGLIVASPTGSTAYALSAQGPILYPTIHSIIVVPICPFNLTNRPVVIPDWMTVEVGVCPAQTNVHLILDGQVDVPIESGDLVEIKRSEASLYLIKFEGKSYFDILRERLMWEVKVDRPGG